MRQFSEMFADNRQSAFTVILDHPIHIEEERWDVALVEIATPSEVLNITEENNFFFLTFLDLISSHLNPLTLEVIGAPQMTLQQ